MKTLMAAAFVITFLAGKAFGQTLAPAVSGGFDLWPLVIIAAVGGVGYLAFLWHKRNPSKADEQIAAAKAEGFALAHKIGDALQNVTKANRDLTMVAVSPPIQATVNAPTPAPAPVATAPAPAPIAPSAPPPVAAAPTPPAPAAAPVVNGAPYLGPYFDENGNPDPKGMYQAYQLKAVFAQKRDRDAAMATGPLNLGALESADKAYLFAMSEIMTFDARDLVSGPYYGVVSEQLGKDTFPEMGQARFNTLEFEKTVTPAVVQVVRDMAIGTAPWLQAAFAGYGAAVYIAGHQPSWAKGWAYVHGGQAAA